MKSKEEIIVEFIENNFEEILEKTAFESVEAYLYLKTEFKNTDVSKNYFFQFVFRSFYGLDSAGLSPEFKKRYFELLQGNREIAINDIESVFKSIASELYEIPNLKTEKNEGKSLQISFVSKLIHTIHDDFPIYDSKVAHLMNFKYLSGKLKLEDRISGYLEQIKALKKLYVCIEDKLDKKLFSEFDKKFGADISKEKKIDFILWSAGKLKESKV